MSPPVGSVMPVPDAVTPRAKRRPARDAPSRINRRIAASRASRAGAWDSHLRIAGSSAPTSGGNALASTLS